MSLKFHWFLPTNGGDGRHVVGGGHGVGAGPAGRPASVSYLGQVARGRRGRRLRGGADPHRRLVRRRLAVHRDAQPGLRAAEVPGRLPPRPDLAVPGRPDGRHLPEPHRRPAAAQRGHRRREPRAAHVRRLPRQGRPLRPLRGVPARRPRAVARRDGDLPRRAPPGRGGRARPGPRPGPRDLLRRLLPRRRRRRRQARRRLPHLGRAAGRRTREDRLDPQARRGRGPRGARSASGCTPSPGTPPRRPGPRPTGCSPASTRPRSRRSRPGCAAASPRGSAGCSSCTRAARTAWRSTPTCWAGVGLVRGGAGTALVGSHEQVADRIEEYAELGIDEFVLSGYPHLEGAYWFGEGVLPILAQRGRWRAPRSPAAYVDRGAVRRAGPQVVTSLRTAVLVGNPRPRSRTLARGHHGRPAADRRGARPGRRPRHRGTGPARLAGPLGRRPGRRARRRRPRRGRQPDVQGHLHRPAQAVPGPVRRRCGAARGGGPADARRRAPPRARRGAAPPAAPHRARGRRPRTRPVRPRPRARPSRGLRRLAGAGPPARDRLRHPQTGATA